MNDGFAEGYAVGQGNSNNNGYGMGGYGWEWMWIIILFALWNRNGFGGNNGGGGELLGYQLGSVATQADVASGFNNSAVLSSLNDLKLGQAGVQQTLCQGFSGVNTAIMQNGYETRSAISDLGYRQQDCCCQMQRAIDGVNYNLAKNTCDITNAIGSSTRDIIDSQREGTSAILNFLTQEKISSLQADKAALTAQLSQNAQTQTLINTLMPIAKPAYITCSPYESAFGYGRQGFNNGCGCGC